MKKKTVPSAPDRFAALPTIDIDNELKKLQTAPDKKTRPKSYGYIICIGLVMISILIAIYLSRPQVCPAPKVNTTEDEDFDTVNVLSAIYKAGKQGKILVNVQADYSPKCIVDIYYPNTTLWRNRNLTFMGDNLYGYNFTVPNTTGYYPYLVSCSFKNTTLTSNMKGSGQLLVQK